MKVVCVIPARLESKRFPKKILAEIGGKTMLEHVFLAAKNCAQFSSIHFAIDDLETAKVIEGFGGNYMMTSKSHETGTARVAEFQAISGIEADVWVIWQGDEPFITSEMIDDLLQGVKEEEKRAWTLKKRISKEVAEDPNVVKVVTDRDGRALYFSRSRIPFDRDGDSNEYFKHVGLYAYASEILKDFGHLQETPLSHAEKLEQLKLMENGIGIQVYPTQHEVFGVDTKQQLAKARDFHEQQKFNLR